MFLAALSLMCVQAIVLGHLPDRAAAAIYWANGNSIGGANSDGSNPNPFYISKFGASDIGRACGMAADAAHIYWTDANRNQIGRANLDGTEPNYSFIAGADEPCGVAVDSGHVYWSNTGGNSIGRANLDGTGSDQNFVVGIAQPCGVALNNFFIFWASPKEDSIGRALVANGGEPSNKFIGEVDGACGVAVNSPHIYWGSFSSSIGRAEIDGSNPNQAFIGGLDRPSGVALSSSHLYWTEESIGAGGRIGSANLDGSAANPSLVTGLSGTPSGIAVDDQPFPLDRSAHLPPSQFYFAKVKHNRNVREPVTFLAIDVAEPGRYSVDVPPGVGWNSLAQGPYGDVFLTAGRKWLAIFLDESRAGKRLGRVIRKKGRVRVPVTFHFTSADHNETASWRNVPIVGRKQSRGASPAGSKH